MLNLLRSRRHLARLVTGKAPRRRRVVPRAVWPVGVDLAYRAHLLQLVQQMRSRVERLFPQLRMLADSHVRADAVADDFAAVKVSLLEGAFASRELAIAVETIGRRTSQWQKEQLHRQLRAAVGVDVPISDPQWSRRITTFTEENVGLIRSIAEDSLGQVQRVVLRGLSSGQRWEEIAETIERRFGVAESRASLIARDQVSRFYSSLNSSRQQAVGITHFFWRAAADERTCPVCWPLNGERFAWSKPPAVGMPGQAHPQCRCNADPDVEALVDSL